MSRHSLAISTIISAIIIGVTGNFLFYEQDPGLSVPLFVLAFLIPVTVMTVRNHGMPSLRKLWLLIPVLFFAIMFVFRANQTLLLLDLLAILALLALFLRYLNHGSEVDNTGSAEHIGAMLETTTQTLTGAGGELEQSSKWLRQQSWTGLSALVPIGRGLLFAIPIVIVFAILFSSADAVFSGRMEDFIEFFSIENGQAVTIQLFIVVMIAWLATGAIAFALRQVTVSVPDDSEEIIDDLPGDVAKVAPKPFRPGFTEAIIILSSVVLLFGFFVSIQFAYFFGGEGAIADGISYADYARRGFFELLAVSVMVLALMLALDHVTLRNNQAQRVIYLILSSVKVVLTLIIMVSAWQRMVLYEQAYGFTYLRVYSHVCIVWLGILLTIGLVNLFRIKPHLFATGLILVASGYIATLNLMNVDYYIAEQNIERYFEGEELDLCYLNNLSVDALPAMLELYNNTESDSILRNSIHFGFRRQQSQVARRFVKTSPFEFNFAYRTAYEELNGQDFPRNTSAGNSGCRFQN